MSDEVRPIHGELARFSSSMILTIDTTDRELITVSLSEGGKVVKKMEDRNQFGSQALLPLIEKLLSDQGIGFSELEGVEVATGPGSFTGIRVGASVANALGYSLGIPVNGKRLETEFNY